MRSSQEERVPLIFDLNEMSTLFLDGELEPTADNIETASGRLGRNLYPALVVDLYAGGLLVPDVAQRVVPAAWSAVEFPSRACDDELWRALFDLAGYVEDGTPGQRPATPLTLWRGALADHRNGWSWTDDRAMAKWFADRPHNDGKGVVWTAEIEPARLLARITQERVGESEYVVDARGLHVATAS